MKKFDRMKTLQLILLIAAAGAALVVIFRDTELYTMIAVDPGVRMLGLLMWLTFGISFIFLLYDFSSYSHMKQENLQLDTAVHSDGLTGVANRYSIDEYIGYYRNRELPEDMGAVTFILTNLAEMNENYGHNAGDIEIQRFAGILQSAVDGAYFIGRNGGNKFVVIIRDCTQRRLARLIAAVECKVEEYNHANARKIIYNSGIAFGESGVSDAGELVAVSDRRACSIAESNADEKKQTI